MEVLAAASLHPHGNLVPPPPLERCHHSVCEELLLVFRVKYRDVCAHGILRGVPEEALRASIPACYVPVQVCCHDRVVNLVDDLRLLPNELFGLFALNNSGKHVCQRPNKLALLRILVKSITGMEVDHPEKLFLIRDGHHHMTLGPHPRRLDLQPCSPLIGNHHFPPFGGLPAQTSAEWHHAAVSRDALRNAVLCNHDQHVVLCQEYAAVGLHRQPRQREYAAQYPFENHRQWRGLK